MPHNNSLYVFGILITDNHIQHTVLLSSLSSLSFPPFCRSLNMDCENQEKDKDGNQSTTGSFNNNNTNNSKCYTQYIAKPEIYTCIGLSMNHSLVCCCVCGHIFKAATIVNHFALFCRYSDYRLHTGPVPTNRSLCLTASHVLLL